mgnify:CR=1 FL=1
MSQTNTLYIVIDPSGAQRGASQTVNAINSVVQSATQLNLTINQIGSNVTNMARNSQSGFNNVSRAVDGLRSTIHAVIGALGAIQVAHVFSGFVDEIKKVDREYNGFIAMMNVTTGDVKQSAEAYENIKGIAMAYGVSIESLAKSYAKLRASTKDVLSTKETDRLFESFTATASVLHAEQYTVERMFNAIIQMASKGQVHMEELKQQLGEHLPGALALAAKAMKMDMGTMIDEMKKGNISARDLLVPLPQILMESFGQAAVISSKSLNAAFMNLKTIWFDSMKELSTNGAGQGLAAVLNAIGSHLNTSSESFKAFGSVVGEAFQKLAEFIRNIKPEQVQAFTQGVVDLTKSFIDFVAMAYGAVETMVEYKNEIVLVVGLLATYKVAMLTAAAANAVVIASANLAVASLGRIGAVLGVIAAAVAGWQIGAYFREKFVEVELAGIALAHGLTLLPVRISAAFKEMSISVPRFFVEMFQKMVNTINSFFASVKNLGSDVLKSMGFDGFEKAQPIKLDLLGGYNRELTDHYKSVHEQKSKIDAVYNQMASDAVARRAKMPSAPDAMGYSKQDFADAEERVARFLANAQAEFEKHDKKGSDKKAKKVPVDRFVDDANREASATLDQYKVFSEQLKTLEEQNVITSKQANDAQIVALTNYTEAAKDIYRKFLAQTKNPEDAQRINAQLLKVESDYQISVTKLLREQAAEREKFMAAVAKAEEDSGILKLSKQEEFIRKWKDNEGKLVSEAQANGDDESVTRLIDAFNYKIGEMDRADKITLDKFFATDDEKWFIDMQEKYMQMHDFIMQSTAFTESEKNALIERLQDDHNAKMRAKQGEMLLSFTGAAGNMVGAFANLAKQTAGESSKAYKTLFAISKAFAIADAMMNVHLAITKAAASTAWPANMAAMASVASAVGGLVNQIASVSFSGAYDEGGAIPAGKWGIVGEYGPEIVNGPANVTSRKDTMALFERAQQGTTSAPPIVNVKNVNVLDPAIVGDYLGTDDGERTIMNVVQRNKSSIV